MSSGSLVNYNRETLNISTEIEPTLGSPIFFIPKSYPKPSEICDPPDREILSYIFYRNRSSPDTSTRPKTRDENGPKMSPNRWFCVMPYRSQSYIQPSAALILLRVWTESSDTSQDHLLLVTRDDEAEHKKSDPMVESRSDRGYVLRGAADCHNA